MYTLNYTIDVATANILFLFNCDDTLTDLDNAVATDLRFATNNLQYDPVYTSTKTERKFVIVDRLKDIFGSPAAQAIRNIDIFKNESALDVDINARIGSDTAATHSVVLANSDQGALDISAGTNNLFNIDISSLDTKSVGVNLHSISQTLLEQANQAAKVAGGSSTIFSRQLDTSANLHATATLGETAQAAGWKCFQFITGDTIQFTVTLSKIADSLPTWAVVRTNATAGPVARNNGVHYAAMGTSGTPTPTIYKVVIAVHATESSYDDM